MIGTGEVNMAVAVGTGVTVFLYWWFVARKQPQQTKLDEFPDEKR